LRAALDTGLEGHTLVTQAQMLFVPASQQRWIRVALMIVLTPGGARLSHALRAQAHTK
jgi:hypothetical protein